MLPRAGRLRALEVRDAIATGKTLRGTYLSAKYVVNKGIFRSSAVVSKKIARSAVARNRLRRSVYAALRAQSPVSGYNAVFFVQKVPERNTVQSFAQDLTHICSKLSS